MLEIMVHEEYSATSTSHMLLIDKTSIAYIQSLPNGWSVIITKQGKEFFTDVIWEYLKKEME